MIETKPHSEFILSDVRDQWWNDDFLQLMAVRLNLNTAQHILDVGSGHGHWGHLLAPYFAPDFHLLGIDKEPEWVEQARSRSERLKLHEHCDYKLGDAASLPVDDQSFDLVTSQTLLMHVANPEKVISEMQRALRTGGQILLAEPNNISCILTMDSVQRTLSTHEQTCLTNFHLTINAGRIALGEGDYSIGSKLPLMLQQAGFRSIRVYMNDRASPVYENSLHSHKNRHQQQSMNTALKEKVANIRAENWLWDKEDAQRLYLAGGGSDVDFKRDYTVFMKEAETTIEQAESGRYWSGGGGMHYLVCATLG